MKIDTGGTLTQLVDCGLQLVIANYSKRLNSADENYTSNDFELPGLFYLIQWFICYSEESNFELLSNDQILKNFIPPRSPRVDIWLKLFTEFSLE